MTRKVSISLIETAIKEKWPRKLAFYYLLKFNYANSCLFDYRQRMKELAGQLDVSEKTLYNYLNFLRSKDLVYDHATNLMIRSQKPYLGKNKAVIEVKNDYSLFDIETLLYCRIFEKKAKKMAFKQSLRRFETVDGSNGNFGEKLFRPSLSFRTLAKILNSSENKAIKVIRNLTRLGVIEVEKQPIKIVTRDYLPLALIEDLPGHRFTIKNVTYEKRSNRYLFEYPVYLKKFTIRQIKTFINNDL
jgi:predicted transcriptional regulator